MNKSYNYNFIFVTIIKFNFVIYLLQKNLVSSTTQIKCITYFKKLSYYISMSDLKLKKSYTFQIIFLFLKPLRKRGK